MALYVDHWHDRRCTILRFDGDILLIPRVFSRVNTIPMFHIYMTFVYVRMLSTCENDETSDFLLSK